MASSCYRHVHIAAQNGFSAASVDLYEKGRPEYSPQALDQICSIMASSSAASRHHRVIELGAGTGKFTGCFMNHAAAQGLQMAYTATEPSDGFRAALVKKHIPNVTAVHGLGNAIPAEAQSVDTVITAQAFHWMSTPETLKEVHRVLRPDGQLVLIWNTFNYSCDWLRAVDAQVLSPIYGDTPRQQSGRWRDCFASAEGMGLFQPLSDWYHDTLQEGDRAMAAGRFMSTSVIAERDELFQQQVLRTLNGILDTHPDLQGSRDSGKYVIPYTTHIAWTKPRPC